MTAADRRCQRPQIVGEFYRLERKLGEGAFGAVFSAVDTRTLEHVAVKLEPVTAKDPQLIFEGKLLKMFSKHGVEGVPAVHWYGVAGGWCAVVMDLMGPNLEELFDSLDRKFSLKTVLMLTNQIISRMESIHNLGFLHRDIKPENFCMGRGNKAGVVHLIDFGLSKQFKDPRTGCHIPQRTGKSLIGTARYTSLNVHEGTEQGRRDDLEAVGHMVIYFLRNGKLPWQGLDAKTWEERCQKITTLKKNTPFQVLCKDHPEEFVQYMEYCRGLEFAERPVYSKLQRALQHLMVREGIENDSVFDWTMPATASPRQEGRRSFHAEAEKGPIVAVGGAA